MMLRNRIPEQTRLGSRKGNLPKRLEGGNREGRDSAGFAKLPPIAEWAYVSKIIFDSARSNYYGSYLPGPRIVPIDQTKGKTA